MAHRHFRDRKQVAIGPRGRRRQALVSHWPPRRFDALGGRHAREFTRAQRTRIAEILDAFDAGASRFAFGEAVEIKAVLDNRESPTRRLAQLLAAAQKES